MNHETTPLLPRDFNTGLSLTFATLCIVDIFGVLPVIALARPVLLCGWYSIPLIIAVFFFQIYTSYLLGESWNIITSLNPAIYRKNRYPLAAVADFTLGRRAAIFVTICLDLTIFGGGVPVLLVAAQNLQLFGQKVSNDEMNLSFCYWLLVIGMVLCPLMWLGSPKEMKWLVLFSMTTVVATAVLIWYAVLMDDRSFSPLPIPKIPKWEDFVAGYGVLAYQFDVHPTLLTVQVDMSNPTNICKAVFLAYLVTGSFGLITVALVIWRYGGHTTANVLEVAPPTAAVQAAILIAAIQLCMSTVLGHSALFQHLEDHLRIRRSFGWKRCAMRTSIVCLAVAVGESVPRFDVIMALIGGTLTGPLVFVLPPLMYSKAKALYQLGPVFDKPSSFGVKGPDKLPLQSWKEAFADPRVHSRSTHYGFKSGSSSVNPGYSFTYYYKNDELDGETSSSGTSGTQSTIPADEPINNDASQPSTQRREVITFASYLDMRNFFQRQSLSDWIGYSVALVGIFFTIGSTYSNIQTTIKYVEFTPPCIINTSVVPPISLL